MKVEGSYTFEGSVQQVWDLLLDPNALKNCIPGVKELKQTGDDQFEAVMTIGIAAVKGTYKGKVALRDKVEPTSYTMIVEGSGGPGFVKGTAKIALTPSGSSTTVAVDGDGQVGGPAAGVAQRMLGGVAKMLMNQFFECMRKQLGSGA